MSPAVLDAPLPSAAADPAPPAGGVPGVLLAPRIYNREGGVQTYLRLAVRALAEQTRLSAVVSLADRTADGAAPAGVRFVGAGHSVVGFARRAWAETHPGGWALVGHARQAPLALALHRAGRLGAYGVIVHGVEVWEPVTRWQRAALRGARFVICTTPFTAERVQLHNGIPDERLRILPLTVAPDRFAGAPARTPTTGVLRLLTLSRLSTHAPDKGVDHAIEAVARLAARGVAVRYDVVGDGDDRLRLERLARESGTGESIVFHGRLSDEALARRFADADAFVLPSKREGFGLVLLEAMQAGLPLVATPEGGIRHVLRDGANGLAVPYGSPDALADALGAMADPARRDRLGDEARADFETRFSYAAFSARLAALADDLAVGRSR